MYIVVMHSTFIINKKAKLCQHEIDNNLCLITVIRVHVSCHSNTTMLTLCPDGVMVRH